jgi:hypothetical protein
MGQTIAEALWEKGDSAGALRASRQIVRQLLANRFGIVPKGILQRIEQCTDLDRLTAAALQVWDIAVPEDPQL